MNDQISLEIMPGHLIRRLNQLSTSIFQIRMKEGGFDVTSVQFAALSALGSQPQIDQATLANMIAYDRATIGDVVKRLVQKGLIERRVDREDRRARKLCLTSAGKDLLADLEPVVLALQGEILSALSEQEHDVFVQLAQKALLKAESDTG
ncbi:MarR family winged helix-turn-helix transcriptional regulator [Roseovarius sp. CAU 1744]|uniref:MarR family winged helix-turn-helix transcriptional regulator n=1 Tax=Roseovarius sp. CAU 1744 TaxID=3140368 RepID=UPI00325B94DC